MRFISFLVKPLVPDFMANYATTIGRTIYTPETWDDLPRESRNAILKHELTHVDQYSRHPIWFTVSYLLLPFPVFFSYFRVKYEIEGYVHNIRAGNMTEEQVVEQLYGPYYFWSGLGFGRARLHKWLKSALKR